MMAHALASKLNIFLHTNKSNEKVVVNDMAIKYYEMDTWSVFPEPQDWVLTKIAINICRK